MEPDPTRCRLRALGSVPGTQPPGPLNAFADLSSTAWVEWVTHVPCGTRVLSRLEFVRLAARCAHSLRSVWCERAMCLSHDIYKASSGARRHVLAARGGVLTGWQREAPHAEEFGSRGAVGFGVGRLTSPPPQNKPTSSNNSRPTRPPPHQPSDDNKNNALHRRKRDPKLPKVGLTCPSEELGRLGQLPLSLRLAEPKPTRSWTTPVAQGSFTRRCALRLPPPHTPPTPPPQPPPSPETPADTHPPHTHPQHPAPAR